MSSSVQPAGGVSVLLWGVSGARMDYLWDIDGLVGVSEDTANDGIKARTWRRQAG